MSKPPRSSRQRYRAFVQDYTQRRLDDGTVGESQPLDRGTRRAYLRDYLRWLRPYRYAAGALLALALLTTGLQMIEPLFMRFIVDRVLLNARLDTASRLARLNLAGAAFLGVIVLSNLTDALRDYRQRLLNVRVMLSLRRSLFQRLLLLPLRKLWDMKRGGILWRLRGDVETTPGLLQMAIVSPAVSLIRLAVAVTVLLALNWRLALTALAIVPAAMVISFIAARRVRPIYRSLRKDVEQIDGRVGEAFSGIRVVRAFRRELQELFTYMVGRHTVLRKELFAHRRELVLWTSWGLLQAGVNVVIVWYGGYMNIAGGASIGDIMAFQWYSFLLLGPVWQIVNSFSELQRSLAAMERVFDVLAMDDDKPDRPGARDAPPVVDEIRFDDVEFAYREGQPVVRDFAVVVPGGSVIALVGRSGAGKTTVTDLGARRQAVRRPAAAAGHRPGDPGPPPDPHPRRGHEQPGHGERTAHPGVDGHAARGPHHVRHRPSALHDSPRRPDPADGRRARHRAGIPRRVDERERGLLRHGAPSDGIARSRRGGAALLGLERHEAPRGIPWLSRFP